MAYIPIPKDLSNVKTKLLFNLTKRQLICFSIAAAMGLPPFFLTKDHIGMSNAMLLMMAIMFPMFMFAMYEKHGQPLEVVLRHYINVRFRRAKYRPYQTDNFYAAIMRQITLQEEVQNIEHRAKQTAEQSRKNRAQASHRTRQS